MIHYYPLISKTSQYAQLKQQVIDLVDKDDRFTSDPTKADMFLVMGGDGFMLECLKSYQTYDKPFVGINCGTLWFLLNPIQSVDEIPDSTSQLRFWKTDYLKARVVFEDDTSSILYCANDIILGNNVLDYFTFDIQTQNKGNFSIQATSIVISTALGSTAYRMSLGGPLIPHTSKLIGIIGMASSPFSYTLLQPQMIDIKISWKNSCLAGFDWYSGKHGHVKAITILPSDDQFSLGFFTWASIDDKRVWLAEQKLGGWWTATTITVPTPVFHTAIA